MRAALYSLGVFAMLVIVGWAAIAALGWLVATVARLVLVTLGLAGCTCAVVAAARLAG